jgi:hypothetical protein
LARSSLYDSKGLRVTVNVLGFRKLIPTLFSLDLDAKLR